MTTHLDPVAAAHRASARKPRLPFVVFVLASGTFLMLTTEFVIAGILPDVAADLRISLAQAGSLITWFAVGMVVGAPSMTAVTMRLPKRTALIIAMAVFVAGHVVVAISADFRVLVFARVLTAFAAGTFWAVSAIVATRAAGPGSGARAIGVVSAGGALATVLGVPAGAFVAQLVGWRGTFWALAIAGALGVALIAAFVPHDGPGHGPVTVHDVLGGLRSGRLWLALLACLTTAGGVLAAYSYIAPTLIDQAGIRPGLVPLVLTGFGVGSLIGTLLGGRYGDAHPGLVTILTPAVTTVLLLGICLVTGAPWVMAGLVLALGLFGLSANGVLIHLVVQHAGKAAPFASALAVSAFNAGTAIVTPIAGASLATPLGVHGPAAVGTGILALTLIPTIALAVLRRRARTRALRHA
ncbi:MAG TPA: MFS transporter [Microbacterium sp.]|uniref:MFS transporter n=1 Tax=Microbacterium sp. TaxID=51671 RepID=UPI002B492BED|nr:MFS transporter [Microbacterium sp.]HKT55449.1 MFS transporter [Microbacterium sp.]